MPHSTSHHGPLGSVPTVGVPEPVTGQWFSVWSTKQAGKLSSCFPSCSHWFMPKFSASLPFPELDSAPSTASPAQCREGREAEHPCSGTRIWVLLGDAWRCPDPPDPRFWQRRSLSTAAPRKFPPRDYFPVLGLGWVWWDSLAKPCPGG